MEANQTTNEEIKNENPNKEIDEILKGYKKKITIENEEPEEPKKKRGRPKKTEPEPEIQQSSLISGALFLLLIDLAIPTILSFVNNKVSEKPIKAKQLKLTKDQREELAPIADEAVKQLMLQAQPLTVFIISLLGIYGLNFMMLKSD